MGLSAGSRAIARSLQAKGVPTHYPDEPGINRRRSASGGAELQSAPCPIPCRSRLISPRKHGLQMMLSHVKVACPLCFPRPSSWIILKDQAATLDGIQFTGRPTHEWSAVESVGETDLALLVTGVVMAEGDKRSDGEEYTTEQVAAVQELWARRYARASRDRLGAHQDWRGIMDGDEVSGDAAVVGFGMSGDDPITLASDDESGVTIAPHSFFLQVLVTGPTAKKLIGDKRTINGFAVVGVSFLSKADGEQYDNFFALSFIDDGEQDVDPTELGQDLGTAFAEAVQEVEDPTLDIDASTLGRELGQAAAEGVMGVEEVDAVALGKQLAKAGLEVIADGLD